MASPLWFIGYSASRRAQQRLDLTAVEAAVEEIEKWTDEGYIIDLMCLDYLQKFPYRGDKVTGVSDNLDEIKRFILSRGIPCVCGVQSVRDVDKRDDPTPMLDDGQWTSNVEQASDKVLSIVRPCQYRAQGESFKSGSDSVAVEGYNQMVVTVLKQKLGPANFNMWLDFDPRYNDLSTSEMRSVDFGNEL
jgi:replicative DNA helicase